MKSAILYGLLITGEPIQQGIDMETCHAVLDSLADKLPVLVDTTDGKRGVQLERASCFAIESWTIDPCEAPEEVG